MVKNSTKMKDDLNEVLEMLPLKVNRGDLLDLEKKIVLTQSRVNVFI